jgi:mRNA interferase MazF
VTPPPSRDLRWAVVIVDLDPTVGHEQAGIRRALVVSYEAFHAAGMASICPISARTPKYPGEVAIPRAEAGQTLDAAVLCHQLRTVDLRRVRAFEIGGAAQYLRDPRIRGQVRAALAHQLGLDIRSPLDGAG